MRKQVFILLFIFVITLSCRLFVAFQTDGFTSDEVYYTLRQVEHIKETGLPILNDDLSFGGRARIVMPFYYYLLALFNLFMPITLVAKIIPNILASSMVFVAYLIARHISKSEGAGLFTAFISGFIPIYFIETVNSVSIYTLVIPLTFYLVYCIMKIPENERCAGLFIILFFILVITHLSAFLLILGLLFYILLMKIEYLNLKKEETELIVFSTFFLLWISFLVYKSALLFHGPFVIWQNIPQEILSKYFFQADLLGMIYQIGLIPLFGGIYVIYLNVWKKKKKSIWLLIGFALSTAMLLWLRLIRLKTGLLFLGCLLALLFAYLYKSFFSYIKSTRASKLTNLFIALLTIIFILTSVYPSLSHSINRGVSIPSEEELAALDWLRENTDEQDTVLWVPSKGNMLNYISKRKNVADTNFLLIRDSDQILKDIRTMYTIPYLTNSVRLLNEYSVDYIILSDDTEQEYNASRLPYYDENCFERVYVEDIKIYKTYCVMD